MMNEMLAFPFVVGVIIGTALLSATITQALPYVPKWFNALKNVKIRKFTNKKPYGLLQLELTQLSKQVDELKEQMDNVAKNHYTRERNRKNNIRREVRDYLEELKNGK